MQSSKRRSGSSEKAFSAKAWDGLVLFFFKTIIPLIPLVGIFVLATHILNSELTGSYRGFAYGQGAFVLDLSEEKNELSGKLLLGNNRYQITQGKIASDRKIELQLEEISDSSISEVQTSKSGNQVFKASNDSLAPEDIEKESIAIEKKSPLIELIIYKDQNDLTGQINKEGKILKFSATRNSFSAFFGRRWINRTLNYFGIRT